MLLPLLLLFVVRALDKDKLRVLKVDEIGNLYVYKSDLVCASELIKRLIEGNYSIVEPRIWGKMLFYKVIVIDFHDTSLQGETL